MAGILPLIFGKIRKIFGIVPSVNGRRNTGGRDFFEPKKIKRKNLKSSILSNTNDKRKKI